MTSISCCGTGGKAYLCHVSKQDTTPIFFRCTQIFAGRSKIIISCQAKFVPQCNDSVIVSAARDGQVMCHVISTTGEPITSKQVGLHRDSAHKVGVVTVIMTSLVV